MFFFKVPGIPDAKKGSESCNNKAAIYGCEQRSNKLPDLNPTTLSVSYWKPDVLVRQPVAPKPRQKSTQPMRRINSPVFMSQDRLLDDPTPRTLAFSWRLFYPFLCKSKH